MSAWNATPAPDPIRVIPQAPNGVRRSVTFRFRGNTPIIFVGKPSTGAPTFSVGGINYWANGMRLISPFLGFDDNDFLRLITGSEIWAINSGDTGVGNDSALDWYIEGYFVEGINETIP